MLEELDRAAKELNISRQAVSKTLIRQALDQQYLARGIRPSPTPNSDAVHCSAFASATTYHAEAAVFGEAKGSQRRVLCSPPASP